MFFSYQVTNTIKEGERRSKKRNIPENVDAIARQLDPQDVELHFMRTIAASGCNRMLTGGLYSLLAHR